MDLQSDALYSLLNSGDDLLVVKAAPRDAHAALHAAGVPCDAYAADVRALSPAEVDALVLVGRGVAQDGAVWRAKSQGGRFERLRRAVDHGEPLIELAREAVNRCRSAPGDAGLLRAAERLSAACFGMFSRVPAAGVRLRCTRVRDGQVALLTLRAVLLDPEAAGPVFYLLGGEGGSPNDMTPVWGDESWTIQVAEPR